MNDVQEIAARAIGDFATKLPEASDGRAILYSHRQDAAQAALDALKAKGLKVVPVEPTEEMVAAYMDAHHSNSTGRARAPLKARRRWKAMIGAAP